MDTDTEPRIVRGEPVPTKVYTYERNRRFDVSRGTRAAFSEVHVPFDGDRRAAERVAMDAAQNAWREEYGEIPWDLSQSLVTHVTCQVVVEFRVEPL